VKNLIDKNVRNVYLKQGEVYVSRNPALVSTVLGSCVSVILHAPKASMGAICHAMLPTSHRGDDSFLYVDRAVRYMHGRLLSLCGKDIEIKAKLFGGANVLHPAGRDSGTPSVGRQNIEAALHILEKLGLNVTTSDTGGIQGRKLFFYSHSGDVFLRQVRKTLR
jgi:chemotaxis protein CheD